jgi:hypothetical protein
MAKQSILLAASIDNGMGVTASLYPREQQAEEGGRISRNEVEEFCYSMTDCAEGYVKFTV